MNLFYFTNFALQGSHHEAKKLITSGFPSSDLLSNNFPSLSVSSEGRERIGLLSDSEHDVSASNKAEIDNNPVMMNLFPLLMF